MSKSGSVIIVEDDQDDRYMLERVFEELAFANQRVYFTNGMEAFQYLKTTTEQPFLIISDMNLPGQNGIEFKRRIDQDPQLRQKSVPFVFFSTAADPGSVTTAYTEMTVQGFFQKPASYEELKAIMQLLIHYWQLCKHPNLI